MNESDHVSEFLTTQSDHVSEKILLHLCHGRSPSPHPGGELEGVHWLGHLFGVERRADLTAHVVYRMTNDATLVHEYLCATLAVHLRDHEADIDQQVHGPMHVFVRYLVHRLEIVRVIVTFMHRWARSSTW